ncbi:hypothetical protein BDY21DRAFT_287939 [Lineolata rhizophorae]|uniref:FAD dependent oxidoreductase domain-containing protein n=1 Tax=Lineolata rhizophorae TaxID=578093 RepID=A0A6A6NXX4_9PEZI|nr:hypothetical protein BDY21DRAFT_287939 [Lineolata rhizophorae]
MLSSSGTLAFSTTVTTNPTLGGLILTSNRAGVVGLQTAVFLLEAGYNVTIVAKHFPGDQTIEYTSPWAGAQWRPHSTVDEPEQCKWDLETYEHLMSIIKEEGNHESSRDLPKSGTSPHPPTNVWFSQLVPSFRYRDNIPPKTVGLPDHTNVSGASFRTICINSTAYLHYLLARATSLGAHTLRRSLPTTSGLKAALDDLSTTTLPSPISAVVNATGLSALALVPDPNVYPIRGQTVLVRGEARAAVSLERGATASSPESVSYAIPRPGSGTTVLGGTKEAGRWTAEAEKETTAEILERCRALVPELLTGVGREGRMEFEVVDECVGLRPGRKGGPRVEGEWLSVEGGKDVWVVHEYGHAGGGYQNSVGSARKAVKLVGEGAKGRNRSRL